MQGHGTKYERRKEQAIAALLTQRSVDEAARSIDIGTTTLLRWMRQPEFESAYREARRTAFSQSVARLQQASGAAVTVLLKIMADANAPVPSRVRAAQSVLDCAARAIEIDDVEARVAALEQSIREQGSNT